MSAKSPTELLELIQDVRRELDVLRAEYQAHRSELERQEFSRLRERLAVAENQLADLKTQFDMKDQRWWQFWIGAGLVGVTFVADLVINLLMFFARKPG